MSTRVTTWVRIDADEGCYLDDESGLLKDLPPERSFNGLAVFYKSAGQCVLSSKRLSLPLNQYNFAIFDDDGVNGERGVFVHQCMVRGSLLEIAD